MKKHKTLVRNSISLIGITAGFATALIGCNSDNSSGGNSGGSSETFFLATLSSVNPSLSTSGSSNPSITPTGDARFTLNGDTLRVNVDMAGLDPNTAHPQFIALGSQCPTTSNDTNHDGVIDAVESLSATGKLLLPLNSSLLDLNNASFPNSDSAGVYTYSQTVSYSQLIRELRGTTSSPTPSASPSSSPSASPSASPTATLTPLPSASPSPSSSVSASPSPSVIGTLGANEDLALNNRVVIVYGVSSSVNLPSTVQSVLGLSTAESVPVACGAIHKVAGLTGPTPTTSPSPTASPSSSVTPSPSPSST